LESKVKNSDDGANAPRPSPITQSPANVWNEQKKMAEKEIYIPVINAIIRRFKIKNFWD